MGIAVGNDVGVAEGSAVGSLVGGSNTNNNLFINASSQSVKCTSKTDLVLKLPFGRKNILHQKSLKPHLQGR